MSTTEKTNMILSNQLPSQAPKVRPQAPNVRPNRVQDLIQDNQNLRSIMRQTSEKMASDCSKMLNFYESLKTNSKKMTAAILSLQLALGERDQTIAFLKAEKLQLRQELNNAVKFAGITINDDTRQMNGEDDVKFKAEVDDTVKALEQELRKSEERNLSQKSKERKLEQRWEQHIASLANWLSCCGRAFKNECKQIIERIQTGHHHQLQSLQRNHEASEQSCKEQVASKQLQLKEKEEDVLKLHSQLESKKSRICQLNRDAKTLEEQTKNMTENIISLKQDLEEVQRHRNGIEESLDQLFKVYNEEREKNQKLQKEITRLSGDLVKYQVRRC